MPHQEHLSQAGRRLAHRSRLSSAQARLAALIGLLCCLWLLPWTDAFAQAPVPVLRAEAVRATGWHDQAPPAEGWTPVALPDGWAARWPGFDGVVWYRLNWDQPPDARDAGLLLNYLNMAGAVYLNGTEISRDAHLTEPLTRAWNTPHYWLLAAPQLRPGPNTLLIRVSGLSAYQPGLGPLAVGPPAAVQALYESQRLVRRDLQVLGLAVSAAVASFFAALWVMRRRETAYGWFALMSVLWLLFGLNQITTSPWPFADTHGWQALNTSLFLAFSGAFVVFTLRFCERRLPRLEAAIALLLAAGWIDLWWFAPHAMQTHRAVWTLVAGLLTLGVCGTFLAYVWKARSTAVMALAPFMALSGVAGAHDLMVFMQVIDSNVYYTTMSSYALLLGMALILAGRFVHGLQRIENFNTELIEEVNAAKAELAATLAQRHALELAHARIGERVNLASDLHDGLGGILVGSIATLEHAPEQLSAPQLLAMLKSLRDDLRLIIDATGQHSGAQTLGDLLVPLRARITGLLDANGIACHWKLSGLDALRLAPSQSLDLLRFLQEALTNVLKHSGGSRVDVSLVHDGGALDLAVRDDGRGFAVGDTEQGSGMGLRSMRARARRMGGELRVSSSPGETQLSLRLALRATAEAA